MCWLHSYHIPYHLFNSIYFHLIFVSLSLSLPVFQIIVWSTFVSDIRIVNFVFSVTSFICLLGVCSVIYVQSITTNLLTVVSCTLPSYLLFHVVCGRRHSDRIEAFEMWVSKIETIKYHENILTRITGYTKWKTNTFNTFLKRTGNWCEYEEKKRSLISFRVQ